MNRKQRASMAVTSAVSQRAAMPVHTMIAASRALLHPIPVFVTMGVWCSARRRSRTRAVSPLSPASHEGCPLVNGAARLVYAEHDAAMVAACNLIALIVVSNRPFYPLYVFWAVNAHSAPEFFTFLPTAL
jgi:hypothetical protein